MKEIFDELEPRNCPNCGEEPEECECYDSMEYNEIDHKILAYRLQKGIIKSDYLQAKDEVK